MTEGEARMDRQQLKGGPRDQPACAGVGRGGRRVPSRRRPVVVLDVCQADALSRVLMTDLGPS
ncbi:MAG: hypothetical protein JWL64_1874 [Frankiales bacterium]|nr:hypothetical protein [Frankiales bacterium]